mgnify:FL=1
MELLFLALLILLMALALGSGFPVAFALPGSAIVSVVIAAAAGYFIDGNPDAYFAHGSPWQWLSAGVTNLRGVYWEVERDTLIAIPLFIFMGIMLQRSKIAEDLLVTMAQLFGPVPGGLGISVVFVGALLAATTGIVGATVVAMGLISLPAMLRNNYSKQLATGTIAASGTLGQIIPPSIVLIILADQLSSAVDQASTARKALYKSATGEITMPSSFDVVSTSAGEMFLGALVPGLVLVGLYMLFILVYALIRPKVAPAVHGGTFDRAFFGRLALALVPPLALIFIVLGSILGGVATVNQAGAIGAVGALLMASYRLKAGHKTAYIPVLLALVSLVVILLVMYFFDINVKAAGSGDDFIGITLGVIASAGLMIAIGWACWRAYRIGNTLQEVMIETAKTTSLVFIILLGAAMLTAAFRAFGGEDLVRDFLGGLPGGFWMKFVIVMAVIFILGFFLDFIEIAVVVVPIVAPILLADPSANVTAVWLGVMIGLNIQTSFLTPPFGFALFYLRGVAPAIVKTLDIYKGVIPFISLQILALMIVGFYPQLVNYLPNRSSLLSETAPPPRNPRLDYCVDQYIHDRFVSEGALLNSVIAEARQLNLDYLPPRLKSGLEDGFEAAVAAPDLMSRAWAAEAVINEKIGAYRPVQTQVRRLEAEITALDLDIRQLKTAISRLRSADDAAARERLQARVEADEAARADLAAKIPADWKAVQSEFRKYLKEESALRSQFRRAAGDGYKPVAELVAILQANADYQEAGAELKRIADALPTGDVAALIAEIEALSGRFNDIPGGSDIASGLSGVRRSLRQETPDMEKAVADMAETVDDYAAALDWRNRAEANLLPTLARYEEVTRDTLGLREQRQMNEEQALDVAACQASHRNVSHYF